MLHPSPTWPSGGWMHIFWFFSWSSSPHLGKKPPRVDGGTRLVLMLSVLWSCDTGLRVETSGNGSGYSGHILRDHWLSHNHTLQEYHGGIFFWGYCININNKHTFIDTFGNNAPLYIFVFAILLLWFPIYWTPGNIEKEKKRRIFDFTCIL